MTESDSNTITSEELATRVRRVVGRRFRRDGRSIGAAKTEEPAVKARSWTAYGYDFLVISLAIFLVAVLILNMSIAGSWRERGNQWGDRARWQRELKTWEQQLTQQEKQLEFECQRLAATLIARLSPEEHQQSLDQISDFRQRLRAANQSLGTTIRQGGQAVDNRGSNEFDSEQLSATTLKTKREQLIEQQYAARSQYNSEHPTLQAIEHQLEELDRQLAAAEESPASSNNNGSDSRVQVIENQYLRNASVSSTTPSAAVSNELQQQIQGFERRFEELRKAAELCLRDIDQEHLALQQSDLQRASAWEQVANSLRAMARECTVPKSLQETLEKQEELRSEPTISPLSLIVCLVAALSIGGGIVWRSRTQAVTMTTPSNSNTDNLSINLVTKQLGCAPTAILSWDTLNGDTTHPLQDAPVTTSGKSLQHKIRFTSECLLAATIAVTLIIAMSHGQFGDWLAANPLTAWGRLWGS